MRYDRALFWLISLAESSSCMQNSKYRQRSPSLHYRSFYGVPSSKTAAKFGATSVSNSTYALLFAFSLGTSASIVLLAETLACVLFRAFFHTSSLNPKFDLVAQQSWKSINMQRPTFDSVTMSRSSAAQSKNGKKGAHGAAKVKRDKKPSCSSRANAQ